MDRVSVYETEGHMFESYQARQFDQGGPTMCTPFVRKEANRLNWLIKGQLIDIKASDSVVESIYESYFKRLWNNTERMEYGSIGFEAAYKAREAEVINAELEFVASRGYD